MLRLLLTALLLAAANPIACRSQDPSPVVFCSYNLENFSDGSAPGESSKNGTKPKSAAAIDVQLRIIREIGPDILGVCEMGSPAKFAEFRQRLKDSGLDYPHSEFVAAADEERHLALVSRFPIVARASQTDVRFELNGREDSIRRGILDVTVEVRPDYRLRLVGVHLKSKLPAPAGEALIRRFEAQKLRAHLDSILANSPTVNLLCYGDFNEKRNEPTFQAVAGPRGAAGFLTDLPCADSLGDRWTHYFKVADEYARIDYLFASPGLLPEIVKGKCGIYRSLDWSVASDHRPVYALIVPVERRKDR